MCRPRRINQLLLDQALNSKIFSVKMLIFSNQSVLTYVMGAQKNRLNETVLLSTHNICFGREIRKLNFRYALLTKVLKYKSIVTGSSFRLYLQYGALNSVALACLVWIYFQAS